MMKGHSYIYGNFCSSIALIIVFGLLNVVASERPIITVLNIATDKTEMYNNLVEKITVDKYINLTIKCEADEPIHWIDAWSVFPSLWAAPFTWNFQESSMYMNSAKFNEGTFRMRYLNNSKHKHPFKSYLDLINIDHKFVGFYFCVKNSSSFSKLSALHEYSKFSNVSNIYLNVIDNDNPIHKPTPDLWVWDRCMVEIPCKATNYYDEIELMVNDQKKDPKGSEKPLIYRMDNAELGSTNKASCSRKNGTEAQDFEIHVHPTNNGCSQRTMITSETDDFSIENSTLKLYCIHHAHTSTSRTEFEWQLPNNGIARKERRVEEDNDTGTLIVRQMNKVKDVGEYKCIVDGKHKASLNITKIFDANYSFIDLTIPSELRYINVTTNRSEVVFLVKYSGYPSPNFTWINNKYNTTIEFTTKEKSTKNKIGFHDPNKKVVALILKNLISEDSGIYTLVAYNGKIKKRETFKLVVASNIHSGGSNLLLMLLILVMTALLAILIHQVYNSLAFEKRLKKGKLIGEGQFSYVFEGKLMSISPFGKIKNVAIKTIKNDEAGRPKLMGTTELLTELNTAKYLRKHPNVVSLLGAVINDPLKGEIMIVYEFCPYGNLSNFLKNNKKFFVNQVKLENDAYVIDLTKTSPDPLDRPENAIDLKNQEENRKSYSKKCVSNEENDGSSNTILVTPFTFTTTDFLDWIHQMAKGLVFLASNDMIHCDLAARNILLCENKTVKISDFGLSRKLYGDEIYKKTSWGPEPRKWMAIESLNEESPVFSVKSDVWSFGIVMWEIFSEGKEPYYIPLNRLEDGIRLKKPEPNATQKMFNIMLSCWEQNTDERPTFNELEEKLHKMHSNALNGIDGYEDEVEIVIETERVDELNRNDTASGSDETIDAKAESNSSSGYNSDSQQILLNPIILDPNQMASNPLMNLFNCNFTSFTMSMPNETLSNRVLWINENEPNTSNLDDEHNF